MKICLASSGEVVASDVRWARTARERTKGLLGSSHLTPGEAVVFEPARQIHTLGMRFPLDVVFCDREWKVLYVVRSMSPGRMTRIVWRARYVLELTAGALPPGVTPGESLTLID